MKQIKCLTVFGFLFPETFPDWVIKLSTSNQKKKKKKSSVGSVKNYYIK